MFKDAPRHSTTPKMATSIRAESIPQEAIDLLIAEHEKHPDNPYMFPSPATGGMYYPDAVTALNTKILKSLGIRAHSLPRSAAPLRYHGAAKRSGYPYGVTDAGARRPRLHAAHLYAYDQSHAVQSRRHRQHCGAEPVSA